MSGTVNIARSLFSHEVFADEPMTEREAWIWLIMEASWKPRTVRAGDYIVDLKRGQLAASIRFIAKAWKWTPPKVQRYFKRLEKMKMITTQADTGVTVLTVCNYDDYQSGGKAADTGPIQDRYTSDTNEKKDEIRDNRLSDDNHDDARAPAFDEFWSEWPLGKIGKDAARKAFSRLSAKHRAEATAGARGWALGWRQANPRLNDIHPSTYLNNKRWTDEAQPSLTVINGGTSDQSPQQNRRISNADASNLAIAVAGATRRAPDPSWF